MKKTKTGYSYSGDLKTEVAKCSKELKRLTQELPKYDWAYLKAVREYEAKKRRIIHLQQFIELALAELEETKKDEDK